jgi:hypothetical protein
MDQNLRKDLVAITKIADDFVNILKSDPNVSKKIE